MLIDINGKVMVQYAEIVYLILETFDEVCVMDRYVHAMGMLFSLYQNSSHIEDSFHPLFTQFVPSLRCARPCLQYNRFVNSCFSRKKNIQRVYPFIVIRLPVNMYNITIETV